MNDADRFKLLHGPYRSPRCRIGGKLFCEVRGWVTVRAMSDGRIVWPMTMRKGGGRPFHIVCAGLARAVKRESATAICHWWGVTPQTVTIWRKALDVPQHNEGTRRLHRDWTPERLTPEARKKAWANSVTPEALAKRGASRRGRPFHPNAAAALAEVNGWRRWTAVEDRLFGVLTDWDIAKKTRRSIHSVRSHRNKLGIAPVPPPPSERTWTPEEDALVGVLPNTEVVKRTGRTLCAVYRRRCALGRQRRRRNL